MNWNCVFKYNSMLEIFKCMGHESQHINNFSGWSWEIIFIVIQIQQYLLVVLHGWKFKLFHKWHVSFHYIFTHNFDYYPDLFLTYPDLQESYAKYPPSISFCPILIHGHLMKTQKSPVVITIPPWYFLDMKVFMIWILIF